MCAEDTDLTLISRAVSGERSALEQLLVAHANGLTSYIARRLPSSIASIVNVEDILQQSLLQAFIHVGDLRPSTTSEGFAAWLHAVADLRILDEVKAAGRQKRGGTFHRVRDAADSHTGSLLDVIEMLPGQEPTGSHALSREEALVALRIAITELPGDQREALTLHLLEGKALRKTAVEMNRTTGAVRGLLHRAKINLAEAMGRASQWMSSR